MHGCIGRCSCSCALQLIDAGAMPLRPGVARLIREAIDAGVPVAVWCA
jgi:hypothetical protein